MTQDIYHLGAYDYHLPEERIAQEPVVPAHDAKLLSCQIHTDACHMTDATFWNLAEELSAGDVLFLNDSYVIKARVPLRQVKCVRIYDQPTRHGKKFVRILDEGELFIYQVLDRYNFECLVSSDKHFHPGSRIYYNERISFVSEKFTKEGILMRIEGMELFDFLEQYGQMPLPPYVDYADHKEQFYQADFANTEMKGSVAAPTAGLHFTDTLLQKLQQQSVHVETISLFVGLGTFRPIFVEDIRDFAIHAEESVVELSLFTRIYQYKTQAKNIIATGTTVARTLESLPYLWSLFDSDIKQKNFSPEVIAFWNHFLDQKVLKQGQDYIMDRKLDETVLCFDTKIYMYPGFDWKIVDTLITNFHLPKTSLLLLVASFMGYQNWKQSYEYAIAHDYQFYSFGDGMIIRK